MRKTVTVAAVAAVVGALVAIPIAVYASHQFTDVSDSNTFHSDISWLADAGVTKGCNPPANTEFCPKDVVTRETMAAFLHRLAVNQVVDAGKLDGRDSADFMGRGYGRVRVVGTIPSTSYWDMAFSGDHPGFISARTPGGGTTCLKPDTSVLTVDDVIGGLMTDASGNDTRLYFDGTGFFGCDSDEVVVVQKSNADGSATNQAFNIFVP
jgi:hypothetical protein